MPSGGDMAPVHEMLRHRHTVIGLGDGGAHVGIMCDATDMAHALTHWTRDRVRGGRLPLADIVRRLTLANAQEMGLRDRGAIAVGMKADINVVDYDRLQLQVPEVRYDLPAGGKRLLQRSVGFDATIVAGVPGKVVKTRNNFVANRINAFAYHYNGLAYARGEHRAWDTDQFLRARDAEQVSLEAELATLEGL